MNYEGTPGMQQDIRLAMNYEGTPGMEHESKPGMQQD
jgi:hypothetical protein